MRIKFIPGALTLWIAIGTIPLFAHHAFESEFDTSRAIRIEGKVTKIEWSNPHVYLAVEVANPGGTANWRIELTSTNDLLKQSMTRSMLLVDSDIAVEGFAAKSEERFVGSTLITLLKTGQAYSTSQERWHQSYALEYDIASSIRLTGMVTGVDRINAHSTVRISVTAANGERQVWLMDAPRNLSVEFGDVVQVTGNGARNGSKKLFARGVNLISRVGQSIPVPLPLSLN